MSGMRRRDFITLLSGAAVAWPFSARAQQPAPRTIGYLSPRSRDFEEDVLLPAFRQGLSETGFLVGNNLRIEYRWAEGQYDRLPALAVDLVASSVELIVTTGGPQPFRAVRRLTNTIPLVFTSGSDLVGDGLVDRLDRPSGNATGVHAFVTSLSPKRLELLRELVPKARTIAFLVNPTSQSAEMQITQVQEAGRTFGQEIFILNASTEREIEPAFVTLVQRGAGALLMMADTFFQVSRDRLVALAARYAIREGWRSDQLLHCPQRICSSGWHLCGSHPQRCQDRRPAGGAVDKIRAGDQPFRAIRDYADTAMSCLILEAT